MAGFKDFGVYFSQRASTPTIPLTGHVIVYALNDGSVMAMGSDGVPFRLDNTLVDQSIADLTTVVNGLTGTIEGQIDTIDADLTTLTSRVTTVEGNVATISGGLASEIASRIAGDANLQSQINAISAAAGEGADAVYATLVSVSGTLQGEIDTVSTDLATETTNRINGDTALTTYANSISSALNLEISNRLAEDTALESEIMAASGSLQLDITNLSTSLATETTNRIAADNAINALMVSVSGNIESDIAAEATARANADSALQTLVNTVSASLATETTNRIAGDATVTAYVNTVSGNLEGDIATVAANLATDVANLATNYYDKTTSDSLFVHLTGDETIAGNKTFTNDVVANNLSVNGNLHVVGTVTAVSASNLEVTDNVMTLNDGETGSGITQGYAGISVDRGTQPNANLLFSETNDRWSVSTGDVTANPALTELAYVTEVDALRTDVMDVSAYLQSEINSFSISAGSDLATFETTVAGLTADLQGQITSEVSRAEGAESTLQSNIDTETAARIAGDNALSALLVTVSGNIESDITNEANARIAADNALGALVTTVSANVIAEATARAAADVSMLATIIGVSGTLQFEIDSLDATVVSVSSSLVASDNAVNSLVVTASGNLMTAIGAEATRAEAAEAALGVEIFNVSGAIEADIAALSGSLGVIMQGSVSCDTVNNLYTISHTTVQTSAAFPVVSLTVPNSGSALYVQGVVSRTATGFDVVLSGVPETSGYVINWIMNMPGNAYIVSAGGGGGSSSTSSLAFTTSNVSISATWQTLSDLTFPVVSGNTYKVDALIKFSNEGDTNILAHFKAPTSGDGSHGWQEIFATTTTGVNGSNMFSCNGPITNTDGPSGINQFIVSSLGFGMCKLTGSFVATSDGNVTINMYNNGAESTSVLTGSWMDVNKI